MKEYHIEKLGSDLDEKLKIKIDQKTKPPGSLGKLEQIALKLGRIQNSLNLELRKPTIVIFAADHGIAKTGLVNPFPQEVTYQMVLNFVQGGAAINVLAGQNKIDLKIVDAGVNFEFNGINEVIDSKISFGTANYLEGPAMGKDECEKSLSKGAEIITQLFEGGCNVVGFGEMGIGNTSSASLLMSKFCHLPIENCVGRGTGVCDEKLNLKVNTLKDVLMVHNEIDEKNPFEILRTFGGFEIAQMCGGMLKAAELGMAVLVDGFISSVALLVAQKMNPTIMEYVFFSHCSGEQGHKAMLDYMNAKPLLDLGMRLGEGSGIAVAYPLINASCTFMNEMASFESAAVSNKS